MPSPACAFRPCPAKPSSARPTQVTQMGAGQIKQPQPYRKRHFLSQSHVLWAFAPPKDSCIQAIVISSLIKSFSWHSVASSGLFWMSPLLGTSCTHQHNPRPPIVAQRGSNGRTWERDGILGRSVPNNPPGQRVYLLYGPLCNFYKTRAAKCREMLWLLGFPQMSTS